MEQTQNTLFRMGKGTLLGLAAALVCGALMTLLFSGLLALGLPNGIIPLFAHLAVLLAGVGGGTVAGLKGKANGLLLGLCTGLAFGLIHFLATLLFGEVSLAFLTYLLAEALGGVLGGILGVNLRKN